MAQYVYINNYSKLGTMAISHFVFYQIAEHATNKIRGAKVKASSSRFNMFRPIQVSIHKGLVTVGVTVSLSKQVNLQYVTEKIQEEIASALSLYTEMVPFRIDVKVANISA
jgi:uncharacterized alkaline shock family protein YloU